MEEKQRGRRRRRRGVEPRSWNSPTSRSKSVRSSISRSSPTCRRTPTGRATQLVAAQDALDTAKVQTDQAAAIVDQRLQVLDPPEQPVRPPADCRRRGDDTCSSSVCSGSCCRSSRSSCPRSLDRTIRVPNDITGRFGVDVLAVVPEHGALTDADGQGRRGSTSGPSGPSALPTSSAGSPTAAWRSSTPTGKPRPRHAGRRSRHRCGTSWPACELHSSEGLPSRLALTSALVGEGVTFITRSLASVIAYDTRVVGRRRRPQLAAAVASGRDQRRPRSRRRRRARCDARRGHQADVQPTVSA